MSLFWQPSAAGYAMSAQAEATRSTASAADAVMHARELQRRIDKLALVCNALWSLVQEKTGLTEQDLLQRVEQLDLTDGRADGRLTKEVSRCGNCGRVMSRRHIRCLYCGGDRLTATAFDPVL